MDLGAANRKLPGWVISRLCRRGGVINPRVSSFLRRTVPDRDGRQGVTGKPAKKGGTAEVGLSPL